MNLDAELVLAINGLARRWPLLDQAMLALSFTSSLTLPGLLLGGYWIWCSRREALIGGGALGLLILTSDWGATRLKDLVGRVRPCQVLDSLNSLVLCGGTASFPSNHAVNTAAAAVFFQVLYPKSGWVSWPIVALVGLSRVYIGAHYVTDILGGWVIGGLLGGGAAFALLQWPRFRAKIPAPVAEAPVHVTGSEGSR